MVVAAALVLGGEASGAKFQRIDGTTVSGALELVDAAGVVAVKTEEGEVVRMPSDELAGATFVEDREAEELTDGVVVFVRGEDRILGTLAASSQASIEVKSAALGKLKLPIEKLAALEFRRPADQPRNAARLREQLLANQTENDILVSANGDQMPGIVVGFDGEQVTLKSSLGEMPLKTSRLFGISFATRKEAPPPPSLLAVVRCTDGSTVTGRLLESKGAAIRLALLVGPETIIPTDQIIDVLFKQGKLVYLSDLKPEREEYKAYFAGDPTWPFQRDRSYDRKPLRIAGKTYRKGLGLFSGMRLTYALGGEFSKFAATAGIDDASVGDEGNVTIRVLADGKQVFEKAGLTKKSSPVAIDLPVKDVKKLELVVEFGENMHIGDLTDLAEARVIR